MNCYNEIKNELINNEVYKRVKDYSKNRSDLITYYNVGKLLVAARKHYRELRNKIKNNKYKRLDNKTKEKLITKEYQLI